MGLGTSLVLLAIGAILDFAVQVNTPGFNVHTVGVVLMVVGVLGIVLSLGLRRIPGEMAPAANPNEPAIYISVLLLMLLVTGTACYIPARRASMVDPNVTLRN